MCHFYNGHCRDGHFINYRFKVSFLSMAIMPFFVSYFHTDIHFKRSMYTYWRSQFYTCYLYCMCYQMFNNYYNHVNFISWPIYLFIFINYALFKLVPHNCFNCIWLCFLFYCILCVIIFYFLFYVYMDFLTELNII